MVDLDSVISSRGQVYTDDNSNFMYVESLIFKHFSTPVRIPTQHVQRMCTSASLYINRLVAFCSSQTCCAGSKQGGMFLNANNTYFDE